MEPLRLDPLIVAVDRDTGEAFIPAGEIGRLHQRIDELRHLVVLLANEVADLSRRITEKL